MVAATCLLICSLQEHAEAALSLHGKQLVPGMKLTVLVSDPQRKKERTDADADEREVYIAGLSRFAKKEDLESIFRQVNSVHQFRADTLLTRIAVWPNQRGANGG